jgi:hypothetical protein
MEDPIKIKRKDVDFDGAGMTALTEFEILVGIPEETTERENLDGTDAPTTNAMIAYIQDQGAPEKNIPQREFMRPGIEKAMEPIVNQLNRCVNAALKDNLEGVLQALNGAGIAAERGIKNAIKEGIPPPLSERTLKERASRGRTGAVLELEARARGEEPGIEFATPLMDTGEMLQSIKYVVRDRHERK